MKSLIDLHCAVDTGRNQKISAGPCALHHNYNGLSEPDRFLSDCCASYASSSCKCRTHHVLPFLDAASAPSAKNTALWSFIVIFILIGYLPCQSQNSVKTEKTSLTFRLVENDSWFGKDKAKHFVMSMLITGMVSHMSRYHLDWNRYDSRTAGITVSLSMGIFKEFSDSRKAGREFSMKDFAADLLGVIVGGLILIW